MAVAKPPRVKSCECRNVTSHFHLSMVRLDTRSLMKK